jgi:hypothetical protein
MMVAMHLLLAAAMALPMCSAAAANTIVPTALYTSLNEENSYWVSEARNQADPVGCLLPPITMPAPYAPELFLPDGVKGGAGAPPPESPPAILLVSGLFLILLGRHRRPNSGTIERHAECADLRCEELAGDAGR